jgi:hypothetical protein
MAQSMIHVAWVRLAIALILLVIPIQSLHVITRLASAHIAVDMRGQGENIVSLVSAGANELLLRII